MFRGHIIKTRYVFYVGLGVFILISVFFLSRAELETKTIPDFETVHSKEYWMNIINEIGGEDAYSLLSQHLESYKPEQQHGAAHIFGSALYSVTGSQGFALCDNQYFNGCIHEYVAQSIFENGFSFITQLNQSCLSQNGLRRFTACQHGIGHGMIAVLGGSVDDLKKALATCSEMEIYPDHPRTIGCKGGVFMEYNMRDIAVGEGGSFRSSDTGLEFPCNELSDLDRLICLSWLPQWWESAFLSNTQSSDALSLLGDYCVGVSNTGEERELCIAGISHQIAPDSNFDYMTAGKMCETALGTPEDALVCKVYVYRIIFYAANKTEGNHEAFCGGMTEKYKSFCVETIKNKFYIAREHKEDEVTLSPLFFYDRELYNTRLNEIQKSL